MPGWLTIIITSFVSLAYLFTLARLIGKRQMSQLSFVDFIVAMTIGSIAAEMATNIDGSIIHGMIAMTMFGLFPIVSEWLAMKSKVMRNFFEGSATVLIKDGKILEDNLKQERLNLEDLMDMLRNKNVFKAADVEFAVMEPSGKLSVLLKAENQPLTAKQLGLQVAPAEEPQNVIMDGQIMDEPLATIGLNRAWLKAELEKAGVALENVFLGQVDKGGQLYLDLYDDKIQVAQPTAMKLTFATLKKCQADLELYALATQSEKMKKTYAVEAKRLKQLIEKMEPHLMR
ncbi:DUF421 domain-containing protein [Brevibacillus sp. SYP-B805]|uniref:DUF421 domain-containing protein n=1 Tax=Brevibacillus sp. SYP-B805 TaxID=1578199 RepID=UPI0013ECBDEE|nr:DUF421 domain-containing protein [Brevibacillus sp. SYP-B805]NGQ97237.1 DUF421 domain-containing protein [Brevibacillus sp. SYP-B805]